MLLISSIIYISYYVRSSSIIIIIFILIIFMLFWNINKKINTQHLKIINKMFCSNELNLIENE